LTLFFGDASLVVKFNGVFDGYIHAMLLDQNSKKYEWNNFFCPGGYS
jgi:hypothetical protein